MGSEGRAAYWIEMSDYDLETAAAMLTTGRFLYVGFMCHQAVEKLLKGHHVSAVHEDPPHTHNLSYLAKRSGLYELLGEEQKDFLDFLEPLNIEARYPSHKEKLLQSLDRESCEVLVGKTREILQWIKQQL